MMLLLGYAFVALTQPSAVFGASDDSLNKPNIVVILADDLGYGDVHCYNPERGKIPTPNMDRLAAQGMRFTDAHSSSGLCSPSRYTILTGRYHWRTRLGTGIVNIWERPLIAPDRMTIGTLAKQQGYRTAAIGKWHLGWNWPITKEQRRWMNGKRDEVATDEHQRVWQEVFSQPILDGPTTRGFDYYFGTCVPNWPPYCFIENDRTIGIPSELLRPDQLTQSVEGIWLGDAQGPALAGWNFERILPALAERAERFITESAAKSKPFLLYMPLTTPHTPLTPNEEWQGKSGLNKSVADLIMETDAVVGRIMAAVEKTGQAKNTLFLMTSDNGFAPYVGAKDLELQGHFPSGPLRSYKGDVYEGGHRIPFIIRWPEVVKPNSVCHQLVHHADLMATLADILNMNLSDNVGEDSFSLLPILKGEDKPIRENAISCAYNGMPGIRVGSWKLIVGRASLPNATGGTYMLVPEMKTQLYNLADDLGEENDLLDKYPDRAKRMFALYEKLVSDGRSNPGPPQKNDDDCTPYLQLPRVDLSLQR